MRFDGAGNGDNESVDDLAICGTRRQFALEASVPRAGAVRSRLRGRRRVNWPPGEPGAPRRRLLLDEESVTNYRRLAGSICGGRGG
jgi:hypothetical protein